jgi:hypothetical protein
VNSYKEVWANFCPALLCDYILGILSPISLKSIHGSLPSSVTVIYKEFWANFCPAFIYHVLNIILFQFIERYV